MQKIFYLIENQFWERSLLIGNQEANNVKTFGYVHSSIRYWDLRFFSIYYNPLIDAYSPNYLLLTHPKYLNYLQKYYPKATIYIVESLRYSNYFNNKINNEKKESSKTKKLLLIADYDPELNKEVIKVICNALESIKHDIKFIIKPHYNN